MPTHIQSLLARRLLPKGPMVVGQISGLTPDVAQAGQAQVSPGGFGAELARAHRQPVTVAAQRTVLSQAEAAATLGQAWKDRFGAPPSPNTLAILTAQWSHETADGQSMFNYNFAGIKGVGPTGLQVTQRTREGYGAHEKVIRDGFRAYETAQDGAGDYLSLLDRKYPGAIDAARQGDVAGFVDELHHGGYFTGDKRAYERNVTRRTDAYLASAPAGGFEPTQAGESPASPSTSVARASDATRSLPVQRLETSRTAANSAALPGTILGRAPSAIDIEAFTDHLALAALRIASATAPDNG